MALKDILVHVDNSRSCSARLETAFALARFHDAHLIGLYVNQGPMLPKFAEASAGEELLKELEDTLRQRAAEAETLFKRISQQQEIVTEWRYVEGDAVATLNLHSRYADLIIMGQGEGDDPRPRGGGLAIKVLMESGRPILLTPYLSTLKTIGKRVLVAWNVRREAVRALNDALPVLEKAERVNVLSINPPSGTMGDGDIPSADICLHLARHGVRAEAQHVRAEDIDVGNLLLSHATEQGADLIVMGAYGHSRLRDFVLGGATRHILEHMTVPVFLSH